MKKQTILLALAVAIFTTACQKSTVDDTNDTGGLVNPVSSIVEVTADITASTTWSASKIYLLKGIINVTSGATLTIPAGTLIKGNKQRCQD